ncbi:hypothetical protein SLA2020_097790 [Shorea laevis]
MAAETAEALAYLHSAASPPIIHRDIKCTNILLDNNLRAKVSDFGASRLVPLDQTQLTTLVQGTLGYLDPQYFLTSQLTDRSAVYSFGVLLVELLTGEKAVSLERPQEERHLVMLFDASMKKNCLFKILDMQIVRDIKADQLREVAELARRCLKLGGDERPCMKEVAMELQRLRSCQKHPWAEEGIKSTDFLLREPSEPHMGNSIGYESMKERAFFEPERGR